MEILGSEVFRHALQWSSACFGEIHCTSNVPQVLQIYAWLDCGVPLEHETMQQNERPEALSRSQYKYQYCSSHCSLYNTKVRPVSIGQTSLNILSGALIKATEVPLRRSIRSPDNIAGKNKMLLTGTFNRNFIREICRKCLTLHHRSTPHH